MLDGIMSLKSRGFECAGAAVQNNNELFHRRIFDYTKVPDENTEDNESSPVLAECGRLNRCSAPCSVLMPSTNNLYAVAVDGNIDNFHTLKKWCGEPFAITTNEDLILALLCVTTRDDKPQDKMETLRTLSAMLEGSPTIAFICNNQKAIYCMVGAKPLLIGTNKNGYYISSELSALDEASDKYISLCKGELVKITEDRIYIYDKNLKKVKKSANTISKPEKNPCEYSYSEQLLTLPSITKDILGQYVNDTKLHFEKTKLTARLLGRLDNIILTGSGSSFNIADIIRSHLELMTDIPVWALPAGELCHSGAIVDSDTLIIPMSASGESTDTILSTIRAKELGARAVGICCKKYSHLERICDSILVADSDFSNSSPIMQCNTAIYFTACLLSLFISNKLDIAKDMYVNLALKMAQMLPGKILTATKELPSLTMLATRLSARSKIIITGLGADYPLSVEGASMLNSISSLSCVPCQICGLLSSYGTSISEYTVIVPITNEKYLHVITPYLLRAKVLGAEIIILTLSNIEEEIKDFDNIVSFDDSIPLFNPLIILGAIYKTATIIDEINNSNRLDEVI